MVNKKRPRGSIRAAKRRKQREDKNRSAKAANQLLVELTSGDAVRESIMSPNQSDPEPIADILETHLIEDWLPPLPDVNIVED